MAPLAIASTSALMAGRARIQTGQTTTGTALSASWSKSAATASSTSAFFSEPLMRAGDQTYGLVIHDEVTLLELRDYVTSAKGLGYENSDGSEYDDGVMALAIAAAVHGIEPFGHHAGVFGLAGVKKGVRYIAANPIAHRLHKGGPADTDKLRVRLCIAGRMTERRQQFSNMERADMLAFNQYAIKVEDDPVKPHQRAPNKAVPMRTCVAPSMIAASKSPDMPMDSFANPLSRAILASSAK